jgi:GR25 family glycosyltransferase involved in LPS biosynthesis
VFEDDIQFSPRFSTIAPFLYAELTPGWDLWHLHGAKAKAPIGMNMRRVFPLRPGGKCWGSHGYLISKTAAAKLLALTSDKPVDVILSSVFTNAGGRVFCTHLSHTLCFQTGDDTDIPATEQLAFWQRLRKRYCR